jgi:glycosyltransferase involved in cell wall biosynthesis
MTKSALLITAHPDDELLWFGGTILAHPDYEWTIVCITQNEETPRGRDFLQVCIALKARGIMLGLEDAPAALLDEEGLENKLRQIALRKQWHIVLTHNANGEYGHIHHRQVHRLVKEIWGTVIESGFGAAKINALVRLPEAIFHRKKMLCDLYQNAGKAARLKLYPPYELDYEPLTIPEGMSLDNAEIISPSCSWQELNGSAELARRKAEKVRRIAVLADTQGWAHDVIIGHVKQNLPPEFELDIIFLYDEHFTRQLPVHVREDDYDLIHLLSWRYWPLIKDWGFSPKKLVTTLIGHRGVDPKNADFLEVMSHFARVSVVSRRLYQELTPAVPRLSLTSCGVDTQIFFPGSVRKTDDFSFGSVGRHYVVEGEPDDIKGWKTILEPLARDLAPLKAYYLQVDKAAQQTHNEMPDFYRQFHCYLCSSKTEGLPLPLLEAAACGLILLSTDVGIAPEIIADGKNGNILPRNVQGFLQAIRALSNQPELWHSMEQWSRKIILQGWDWWSVTPQWAEFYQLAC